MLTSVPQDVLLLLIAAHSPSNAFPSLDGAQLTMQENEKIRLAPAPEPGTHRVFLSQAAGIIAQGP